MAIDKLVDSAQLESDLTDIADAIRAKTGGTADLQFPADFVSEIGSISGEGGYSIDDIFSGNEPSGDIVINATTFKSYALANRTGITSVTFTNDLSPAAGVQSPFSGCTGITSVSAPKLTHGKAKLLNGCTNLRTVDMPLLNEINGDQFIEGSKVVYLVFPAFTRGVYNNSLRNNTLLQAVDLAACTSIGGTAFSGCSVFDTFIIRGDSVPTLSNISAFNNTPFASGKAGGTLYVPSAMTSSYQSATNWSTILGYANNSIEAIEGSQYENYYVDGTPIPTT